MTTRPSIESMLEPKPTKMVMNVKWMEDVPGRIPKPIAVPGGQPEPTYLTVKQVAEHMNLDLSHVYYMIRRNELPGAIVLGRRAIRIHGQTLYEWLEQKVKDAS